MTLLTLQQYGPKRWLSNQHHKQMCFPKPWSRPQPHSEGRGLPLALPTLSPRSSLPCPVLQAGALLGGCFNTRLELPLMCHFLFEMQCLAHLIPVTFGKLLFSLSDRDVRGVEFIFERDQFEGVFLLCFFFLNVTAFFFNQNVNEPLWWLFLVGLGWGFIVLWGLRFFCLRQ